MTKEQRPPAVNYLDEAILKELCHKIAVDIFPNKEPLGTFTDHDPEKLDASLNLPKATFGGSDLYPTLADKAAILCYALNRNHAFGNGNKRISAAALVVFLYINDRILLVSTKGFFEKTLWVAKTEEPIDEVKRNLSEWISACSMSKEEYSALAEQKKSGGANQTGGMAEAA